MLGFIEVVLSVCFFYHSPSFLLLFLESSMSFIKKLFDHLNKCRICIF